MIMVASYCHISADKDDLADSLSLSEEYIARQPNWELCKVYGE